MSAEDQNLKFEKAKDRVQKIRGFYLHLLLFVVMLLLVILLLVFGRSFCIFCVFGDKWSNLFVSFAPWFILLLFNGFSAFGKIKFLNEWEEKKLKQFMDE